jgi:hypothetical protein
MKPQRKYLWLSCPIYPLLYDIIEIYRIESDAAHPAAFFIAHIPNS